MPDQEVHKDGFSDFGNLLTVVKLNVGGQRFVAERVVLTKFPDSMLGVMFSGHFTNHTDIDGYVHIDRDGTLFKHILTFLSDLEKFSLPESLSGQDKAKLKIEANYFGLDEVMFPSTPESRAEEEMKPAFLKYIHISSPVHIPQDAQITPKGKEKGRNLCDVIYSCMFGEYDDN